MSLVSDRLQPLRIVAALSGAIVVIACSADVTVESTQIVSVSIQDPPRVMVAQEVGLVATVFDQRGTPLQSAPLTWRSSDTLVAKVSSSGRVRGQAQGTTGITASAGGQSATVQVVVVDSVATVVVSPSTVALSSLGVQQFTVATLGISGTPLTGRGIVWSSSDTAVARVSGAGLVTARVITGGTVRSATITATSEARSASATVSVTPAAVNSITLAPLAPTVKPGGSLALVATLRDVAGNVLTGRTVSWSSNAPAVAPVTSAGVVSGSAGGSATITASAEGKSGSVTVLVGHEVVTGGTDSQLKFWNPYTGALVRASRSFNCGLSCGWIGDLSFTADGKRLLFVSSGTAYLWDVDGDSVITTLSGAGGGTRIAMRPDGTRAFAGIALWDLQVTPPGRNFLFFGGTINGATYSADGSRLLVSYELDNIQVRDGLSGSLLRSLSIPSNVLAGPPALSPNGQWVAAHYSDGVVRVWSTTTWQVVFALPHTHSDNRFLSRPYFFADGNRLLTASTGQGLKLWSLSTGGLIREAASQRTMDFSVAIDESVVVLAPDAGGGFARVFSLGDWSSEVILGSPGASSADTRRVLARP